MELNALPSLSRTRIKNESNADLTTIKGLVGGLLGLIYCDKHQCLMICMNLLCRVVVMTEIEL